MSEYQIGKDFGELARLVATLATKIKEQGQVINELSDAHDKLGILLGYDWNPEKKEWVKIDAA